LRVRAKDVEVARHHAARELVRLQLEPRRAALPRLGPDDLAASCRELGLDFGAEELATPSAFRFAAGLTLAAGSDGGPSAQEQQRDTQLRRSEHAQSVWERALAQAEPKTHGDSDALIAQVSLDNGARIDVQFTHGSSVAVAIRVGVGAEHDSPLLHGQTALLATMTSTSCAGMGPELLHDRFERWGATLAPRVDAESYGLLLRVPKEHFDEAFDLALRCMRAPSRDARELVEAEVHLQDHLRKPSAGPALRARAANLVAPRGPGALAPWGDPERVPNIAQHDVEHTFQLTQLGERWAVAVVGPVDVRASVALAARRLADLPSNVPKAAPLPEWVDPAAVLPSELPHTRESSALKLLAVWTARGPFDNPLGARLFTRALATVLTSVPGLEVSWQDADVYKQTSFAALALSARPELAGSLPAILTGALRDLDDAWLERALKPAVAEAADQDSAAQAELATRAERVARQRLGAVFGTPKLESATKLVQALRASRPGFAPLP
jgi:predicted Zn-dependent peptidase